MRFEGFVGPSYAAQSPNVDCQRAINIYPEIVESRSGKSSVVYFGKPGRDLFCQLPTGPIRGILADGSPTNNTPRCFAVGGSTLYEVFSNGTWSILGDVQTDSDDTPVQMFVNGTQLWIVSAGQSFIADGMATVNAGGQPPARTGAFLDGYFIAAAPDARTITISDINDGTSWPGDTAVKEGYPDLIAAIVTNHSDLWVFGESSTEVWRNTGNADFPFERDPGAFINYGAVSCFSPTRFAGTVAWLGVTGEGGPTAFVAQGYTPVRVSTAGIEDEWSQYEGLAYSRSWTYDDRGHQFWVLDFPTEGRTWVYDAATKMWHERTFWTGSVQAMDVARCHAYVFEKHLVGSRNSGDIYVQSHDYLSDYGTPIYWQRIAPHISNEGNLVYYHRLTVDIDTGSASSRATWRRLGSSRTPERSRVFRVSGIIGSNEYSLDWSEDSARTWSTAHTITVGAADRKLAIMDAFLDVS